MRLFSKKRRESKRGAALPVTLIVMVLVGILAKGILYLSGVHAVETATALSGDQAFWTAEAGLEHAKAVVSQTQALPPDTITGTTGTGSYSAGIDDDPDWCNIGNATKKYVITSTGTSLGSIVKTVQLRVTVKPRYSFFGKDLVQVSSGSSLTGDAQSNGDVEVLSDSSVDGDATCGPGGSVNVDDDSSVSGSAGPAAEPVVLEPVDAEAMADAEVNNNNDAIPSQYMSGDALDIGVTTFTMPAGTYYFSWMKVAGTTLNTGGPVTIYCEGDVYLENSAVINANTSDADQLEIYTTTTKDVKIGSDVTVYAHIYAPDAEKCNVTSGSEYYGSLVGGGRQPLKAGARSWCKARRPDRRTFSTPNGARCRSDRAHGTPCRTYHFKVSLLPVSHEETTPYPAMRYSRRQARPGIEHRLRHDVPYLRFSS